VYSSPARGRLSGGVLGHIGTCVCPGDGSQEVFCAGKETTPEITSDVKIKVFNIIHPIPGTTTAQGSSLRALGF